MQFHYSVQMECWYGVVVDINATSAELGPKCLQLVDVHVLSGCNTTTFSKGQIGTLNTPKGR